MTQPTRVGIVGCGAIAETGHLPACMISNEVDLTALADIVQERALNLARKFSIEIAVSNYQDITAHVDAVIIATPPHLHLEQIRYFMEHGVHILCEKPLTDSTENCLELVKLSQSHPDIVLATGHVRRFFFYSQQIKTLIQQGDLGQLNLIQADEGYPYNWPAYTDFAFQRSKSPGGVMFDLGIHLLDMFQWLGGDISEIRYADDAIGGLESNAEAVITFANGTNGKIRVSRTCERPNRLLVQGNQGYALANVYVPGELTVRIVDGGVKKLKSPTHQGLVEALNDQLNDFIKAIQEKRAPLSDVQAGFTAIQLLERCYAQKKMMKLPPVAPLPGIVRWT